MGTTALVITAELLAQVLLALSMVTLLAFVLLLFLSDDDER